ncbi:hypothetical protein ACH5RR_006977 [Cinchona calisaya]|uniref:Uncharacterized protein n=1 Tax=Cinchona calisaya TaxID=153742 RepID=A0ABD3AQK3_9GENT
MVEVGASSGSDKGKRTEAGCSVGFQQIEENKENDRLSNPKDIPSEQPTANLNLDGSFISTNEDKRLVVGNKRLMDVEASSKESEDVVTMDYPGPPGANPGHDPNVPPPGTRIRNH